MRESTIDKRLKILISYFGITQKELSQMTGIREQTISNYFTAQRDPKVSMIIKIAETFHVSPNWIIGYGSDDQIELLK